MTIYFRRSVRKPAKANIGSVEAGGADGLSSEESSEGSSEGSESGSASTRPIEDEVPLQNVRICRDCHKDTW